MKRPTLSVENFIFAVGVYGDVNLVLEAFVGIPRNGQQELETIAFITRSLGCCIHAGMHHVLQIAGHNIVKACCRRPGRLCNASQPQRQVTTPQPLTHGGHARRIHRG